MRRCKDYAAHYPKWDDWRWQVANRITTADGIAGFLGMAEAEKDDVEQCLSAFRMAVTPYYASLIDPEDPDDPIRKVCVPSIQETCPCENDMADPLGEVSDSPVPHIVHRYPDRVLFLVTLRCSTYCRYCTRRRVVGEEDRSITEPELKTALGYIRSHPEIRDVLISGGDPLVMTTNDLILRFFKPDLDDRKQVVYSRVIIVLFSIVAYLIATQVSGILGTIMSVLTLRAPYTILMFGVFFFPKTLKKSSGWLVFGMAVRALLRAGSSAAAPTR